MWAHKEGSQPEHKAIEHGEIRRTLSGAIADQELMFEQERFSCDLARAARAEEFREGHEQMDRQEEQIAHELKIIMPANLRKTAPQRRFMPKLPIRHPHPAVLSNTPPPLPLAGRPSKTWADVFLPTSINRRKDRCRLLQSAIANWSLCAAVSTKPLRPRP